MLFAADTGHLDDTHSIQASARQGVFAIRNEGVYMRKLAIAWRNPIPAHHLRRWQRVAKDSAHSVYAVQQLVKSGTQVEWSNTTCLELVRSKKMVPREERKPPLVRWLLTSIPY